MDGCMDLAGVNQRENPGHLGDQEVAQTKDCFACLLLTLLLLVAAPNHLVEYVDSRIGFLAGAGSEEAMCLQGV